MATTTSAIPVGTIATGTATTPALTTNIQVEACDNELYILASSTNGVGGPSTELCHLTSGYYLPVNYGFNPGAVLQPGTYDLFIMGINWGGPANFKIVLTTGGVEQPPIESPGGTAVGVWSPPVQQITVARP